RVGRRRGRARLERGRGARAPRPMAEAGGGAAGAVEHLGVVLLHERAIEPGQNELARRRDEARQQRVIGRRGQGRREPRLDVGERREVALGHAVLLLRLTRARRDPPARLWDAREAVLLELALPRLRSGTSTVPSSLTR